MKSTLATDAVLELREVSRVYRVGGEIVRALDGVSLTVRRGELVAIMGRSGSGKSTLLNAIGCLDRPTAGAILLDGVDVTRVPARELPRIRREKLGFIFRSWSVDDGNVIPPGRFWGTLRRASRCAPGSPVAGWSGGE
jgi:putative ABC transport system ATP-binding protein